MAALSIQVPYPVFYDRDGQPLDNGNIYIGVANLDPVTNPLTVYYDEALTITASQPLVTSNGYVYRNGTPTQLYVNAADFSITVNDSKGLFVYSFPEATGIGAGAASIEYDPPFPGAVTSGYTVQDKLSQYVTVDDFGAVGDGVTDDSAAINAALAASSYVCTSFGKTYAVGSTIQVPINTTFDMSGSVIEPLLTGTFTPIIEEPTYSAVIALTGIAAKITGGFLYMAGTTNLVGVYFREFQQKATLVTVDTATFGFYGRNHSCIFFNNVFNKCTTGIKGISNDFNGNQISNNVFEECDICIVLENRGVGMSSSFIRGNLFNLYYVNGISINSVSSDMNHIVIEQNYFESTSANNKAIRLYGAGAFPSMYIHRNISFGNSASSTFAHLESAGALHASDNSIFQHAYGLRSNSFSGEFVARNNYITNVTTPYTYVGLSGAVEISDYNFTSPLGSQTDLLKIGPQIYAGANTYDIGAMMNGSTTSIITDVTGTSISNGGKYAGAGSSGLVTNTQSVFTSYVAQDLKFDMQAYIGDGWIANLTCRQNPSVLADYYALGVRLSGGTTYQFVLQGFGSATPFLTEVTTALPSDPRFWGVRGRIVGEYFYLESYDPATGAKLDSHTFTNSSYTIGLAGMFCNSSEGAGNAYIGQMFIGPC